MEHYIHDKCVKGLVLQVFNSPSLSKNQRRCRTADRASTAHRRLSYSTQFLHAQQGSLYLLRVPRWGGVVKRAPDVESEDLSSSPTSAI